jgi:small subunit ribosomal protein S2
MQIKLGKDFGLDLKEMVRAGLHLGHRVSKLHPNMKPFVFGMRKTVHIIDLEKTRQSFSQALEFIEKSIGEGKTMLMVGTKVPHNKMVEEVAKECELPYVTERWLGGFLTNFATMRKRVEHFKELRDLVNSEEFDKKHTKKERMKISKELSILESKFGGVEQLEQLPDILFICDINKDSTAVREAKIKQIPVVAICDTNTDPGLVDWPIPANDDAISSVKYILEKVKKVVLKAKSKSKK